MFVNNDDSSPRKLSFPAIPQLDGVIYEERTFSNANLRLLLSKTSYINFKYQSTISKMMKSQGSFLFLSPTHAWRIKQPTCEEFFTKSGFCDLFVQIPMGTDLLLLLFVVVVVNASADLSPLKNRRDHTLCPPTRKFLTSPNRLSKTPKIAKSKHENAILPKISLLPNSFFLIKIFVQIIFSCLR